MGRQQGPRIRAQLSSFSHPKSSLPQPLIASHAIAAAVQIDAPRLAGTAAGDGGAAEQRLDASPAKHFFLINGVPLGDLVRDLASSGLLDAPCSDSMHDAPPCGFLALSATGCMDSRGSLAITPDGLLHLALTREVGEALGLQGTKSVASPGERLNVTVKLTSKNFKDPSSSFRARVIERLNTVLPRLPLICCSASPADGSSTATANEEEEQLAAKLPCLAAASTSASSSSSPSSSSAAADKEHGPTVRRLEVQRTAGTAACSASSSRGGDDPSSPSGHLRLPERQLEVPLLDRSLIQRAFDAGREKRSRGAGRGAGGDSREAASGAVASMDLGEASTGAAGAAAADMEVDGHEGDVAGAEEDAGPEQLLALHEWLGALACQLEPACCNGLLPFGLSASSQRGTMLSRRWTGLMSTDTVSELFALARSLVDDGLCPWACFSCWGHADSPIAWAGHEHSIHPQGHSSESQYTVLVLPAGAYCSFVALGSNELTLAAGGKPSATPQ